MIEFFRRDGSAKKQDAISEGRRFVFVDGEVQRGSFGVEGVCAERVDSEQAVSAGVPVGGIAGVSGVVEDGDGLGLAGLVSNCRGGSGELAPAAARAPDGIANLAFTCAIDAAGSCGIGCRDLGC